MQALAGDHKCFGLVLMRVATHNCSGALAWQSMPMRLFRRHAVRFNIHGLPRLLGRCCIDTLVLLVREMILS